MKLYEPTLFIIIIGLIGLSLMSLISLSLPTSNAQLEISEEFREVASSQQSILDLEVLIFSDGSAFLQGQASSDPDLPVKYENGKISGLTNELTSKERGVWHFSLKTDVVFERVNARFVLPANAKLVSGSVISNSLPVVYIRGNSLVTEISDIQKPLQISFSYELPLTEKETGKFPVVLIYVIAIAIAILILFLLSKRKPKSKASLKRKRFKAKQFMNKEDSLGLFKKKFESLKQTLNDREIKIVEGLIELKGKAKQNQLQKFTAISKAAFSRHIAALEVKGLVEKKSLGRVNLIQIKPE